MNTNDPAAKYGKPDRRDYTEREYDQPLLVGDRDLYAYTITENGFAGENKNRMLRRLRHFYENLIHEGRLRVVEECRVKIDTSPGEWNGMHLLGCNGRGPVTDEVFCPYCGNKIIKPTNP